MMRILCRVIALFAVVPAAPLAAAQTYPDKPIRVIVAVPSGGSPDILARILAPGMSGLLGQQLVVDDRGGAGGLIGTELAARAAPDGYTLFLCSASFAIQPHLRTRPPYDPVKDFSPVGLIADTAQVLVVRPALPVTSIKELIALAKAQPGKLNYASAGIGSPIHLAMELFDSKAGVQITHVAYKGVPQAMTDLLGGAVDLTITAVRVAQPLLKAGRLRALGITSARRSALLSDVPTISEAGVQGYEWGTWYGLLAPAGTPKAIITRLNATLLKTLQAPEVKSQFEAQGNDIIASSPEEFAAFIRREYAKIGQAVKLSGLQAE